MKKILIPVFIGLGLMATNAIMAQSYSPTTHKEQIQTIKTYPFSDPDPIANPAKAIYPYFRYDGFTAKGVDQEWKMIELENQFIKVKIAPEIGGKVWGAMEKKSGENFLYDNDVVKFRDIAMRGPWTSGGVEINFGIIGHAPWTSNPVEYKVRENADGSVSCFVGTLDLITRAWWSCEIKLEKDKAYFTTSTKWYNPTLVSAPYYNWMNAGYDTSENAEFFFPGDNYVGHDGDIHSWPMDEKGRNISRYNENNFGSAKSYHIRGNSTEYFATYWQDKAFGSGHYSANDEKLGMKIFLWGLSRAGMIWEGLLTDNAGQYVELQSGKLFNQETSRSTYTPYKHHKLNPAALETATEYWYPIKDTKGVLHTNRYATINIKDEDGTNKFYLSALQNIKGDVTVKCNGKEVYSKTVDLEPMESFEATINGNIEGDIEVILGDNLLVYSKEYTKTTSRPNYTPKDFDLESLYGRYVMGCQFMHNKEYARAKQLLGKVLEEDENYAPALNALATIYFKEGKYQDAKDLALHALSIDTYDADANIMYGATSTYLGETNDAVDGFSVAALSASHRVAAYIGLAKEYAKRAMWERCLEYAEKIETISEYNSDAKQLKSVAYRNLGKPELAEQALEELEIIWPVNPFIGFEQVQLNKQSSSDYINSIESELSQEIILEVGLWYETLGQIEDAIEVYSLIETHPSTLYRKAYLQHLTGADYKATLEKAESLTAAFMLPSRHESLATFEWAVSENDNWKNKYYLALLEWHLGDKESALTLLESLGTTPDFAPFYITRSLLKSGDAKIADLLKSEELEVNWRIGTLLIKEYKAQDKIEEMSAAATKYNKLYSDDFRLGMAYVPVLIANKEYKKALKYLENVEIIPYEGGTEGRSMYRDCNLLMALEAIDKRNYKSAIKSVEKSEIWIENLGVGKSYDEDIDLRTENYILAYCYEKLGQQAEADKYYNEIIAQKGFKNSNTILTLLAYKKFGRSSEAKELLDSYLNYNSNQLVAEWSEAFYNEDYEKAAKMIEDGNTNTTLGIFGDNAFKDLNFFNLVKLVVELK